MKRIVQLAIVIICFSALALAGCAVSTRNQAQLNAGLQVVDETTTIALELCRDGVLPHDQCTAIAAGSMALNIIEQLIDPYVETVE